MGVLALSTTPNNNKEKQADGAQKVVPYFTKEERGFCLYIRVSQFFSTSISHSTLIFYLNSKVDRGSGKRNTGIAKKNKWPWILSPRGWVGERILGQAVQSESPYHQNPGQGLRPRLRQVCDDKHRNTNFKKIEVNFLKLRGQNNIEA